MPISTVVRKTLQLVSSSDKAVAERRTPPEAVANLPGNYGEVAPGVPVLGTPLPGDLGRPILDRQRQLEAGGGAPGDPAAPPTMTPEEQAAEAERQRIAAQAAQAREAGVMVQSSGRSAAASVSSALGGGETSAATAPSTAASEGGRLALDTDRDQNNQQRKLDFIGQSASGGIYNAHALQTPASPHQVMAGSVIAASLLTGLNSDLPGMVVAQVTENCSTR